MMLKKDGGHTGYIGPLCRPLRLRRHLSQGSPCSRRASTYCMSEPIIRLRIVRDFAITKKAGKFVLVFILLVKMC